MAKIARKWGHKPLAGGAGGCVFLPHRTRVGQEVTMNERSDDGWAFCDMCGGEFDEADLTDGICQECTDDDAEAAYEREDSE